MSRKIGLEIRPNVEKNRLQIRPRRCVCLSGVLYGMCSGVSKEPTPVQPINGNILSMLSIPNTIPAVILSDTWYVVRFWIICSDSRVAFYVTPSAYLPSVHPGFYRLSTLGRSDERPMLQPPNTVTVSVLRSTGT